MLSHHQLSLSKPCESYQHVKDGESWALLRNREPQTNWCPWLTFMWSSIHAKSVSLVQVWGRDKFEGNGACPSMAFVAGCRWAAVRVISPPECDPGSSSLGYCTGVQHGMKPDKGLLVRDRAGELKGAFHHPGAKRKGKEMYLSAFVVWKWKDFLRKKNSIIIFRPEIWPRYCQKIQVASWARGRTVRGPDFAVQWLNPRGFAIFVFYCALCNFPVTSLGELGDEEMMIWCLQKTLVVLFIVFKFSWVSESNAV